MDHYIVKSNVRLCREQTCTPLKSTILMVKIPSFYKPIKHTKHARSMTFLQRTYLYDFWRESNMMILVGVILLGFLTQQTTGQINLPSYSDTSTFEWYNPDSLDPEGLNVCLRDRLTLAVDVLSRRKIIQYCDANEVFNPITCRALRGGHIAFNDLYVRVNVVECCDGWLQSHNLCTQRCPPGTYGPGCRLTCQCSGQIQLGCHHVTGECFCPTGRTGIVCETTCTAANNTFGPRCTSACPVCRNGGVCSSVSGECLCPPGWTGRTCTRRNKSQSWPLDCTLCDNESTCDRELELCMCNPGWRGRYCTEPCPVGTYGPACRQICTCLHKGVCLHEDGSCVCPTGWIGAHCETACPESYYGDQCEMRCDCPDGRCDPFTGDCICPNGRIGPRCISECLPGYFGRHCAKKCDCPKNYDCDPVSGACYKMRDIITTTAYPDVNNTTTTTSVTTPIDTETTLERIPNPRMPKFDDDDGGEDVIVSQFEPMYPISLTEAPKTRKPSLFRKQILIGTSLGGVLVLAVLLTIVFIWIVFQRRDSTKSAKPFELKQQNKNNNSETGIEYGTVTLIKTEILIPLGNTLPSENNVTAPAASKPKPMSRARVPYKPNIFGKPIASINLNKEPVYESISDDQRKKDMNNRFNHHYNNCDSQLSGFNNPSYRTRITAYSKSISGSLQRKTLAHFTSPGTILSARGTENGKRGGHAYESPTCEIELTKSTRGHCLRAPSVFYASRHGYLALTDEHREAAGLYIGLLK